MTKKHECTGCKIFTQCLGDPASLGTLRPSEQLGVPGHAVIDLDPPDAFKSFHVKFFMPAGQCPKLDWIAKQQEIAFREAKQNMRKAFDTMTSQPPKPDTIYMNKDQYDSLMRELKYDDET